MNKDIHCPLCDSTEIETKVRIKALSEPFGGSAEAHVNEHHCDNCGMSGDFLKNNDDIIQEVLDQLKKKAAISILSDFANHDYNFSSLERALELPQRTLTKWKTTGKTSAAGLTLLRFLRLFPWLIEVADKHFDFQEGQRTCINAALKTVKFQDPLSASGTPSNVSDNFYVKQYNSYFSENSVRMEVSLGNEKNLITVK
jgi:hypothetical protein